MGRHHGLQVAGIILAISLAIGQALAQQTEVEPNGNRSQATEFVLGTSVRGLVSGDDYDWYRVHVDQGGLLTWSVTNVDAGLNVWIRPSIGDDRNWWDRNSKGAGAGEASGLWVPAGDWYLLVHNAWDGTAGNYTVTASLQPVSDPHEPNDSFATAATLTSGVAVSDAWIYYNGDLDFYRINLTVTSQLNVNIGNMGDRIRWRYQLYNENQALIFDSDWRYADHGTSSIDNWFDLAAGAYFLRLFARTDYDYYDTLCFSTRPYTLKATVYPAQDPHEPNNTFATSTPLNSGEAMTSARLYLAGDVDYYRFTLTDNSQVTVYLANPPERYYRYQLYNSGQNVVYNRGGFLGEISETHHLPPDTYYLRVFADEWNEWRRWSPSPYTLKVAWTGYPDPHEPNNDAANATPLPLNQPLKAANLYLIGDHDYYKFSAPVEKDYTISLYGVPWPLAPRLRLLNASGQEISHYAVGSGEDITFGVRLVTGDYLVHIFRDDWDGWRRFSPNPYSLIVTDAALPAVDRLELTPAQAVIDPGYSASFTAWPRAADGGPVPFPGNVQWTVTPGTGDGTVSVSDRYNITATFTASKAGTAVVTASVGGKTAQAAITIPEASDPHEPNNSIAGSTPLTFGVPVTDALLFGNGDVDYYEVQIGGPGKIRADLTNVGLTLDAVLGLRDVNGGDMATVNARGGGGDEGLLAQITAPGSYYLVVWSNGNASRSTEPYRLNALFTPVTDPHEVNNSFDSGGTPIQLNQSVGDAYLFPAGDVDYYVFTVPGPGDITVEVTNVAATVDAQLNLANSSRQWLFSSNVNQGGYGESETATAYVDAGGTYWAWVGAQGGDSGASPYTLRVTHTALTAFDPYERNDTLADARFVASGSTITDSSLFRSGDTDYFRTTLDASGPLSFLLSDLQPDMDGWLQVYDAAGNQVASADRTYAGQPEFVSLANLAAGDYTVRVGSSSFSRTPYKLGINTPIGRLIGQVTRPGGNLLAGATVTAYQGGEAKASMTTGADGFYALILGPGVYDVTATVLGFADKTEASVDIPGGVDTSLDFEVTDAAPPAISHLPVTQFKAGKDLSLSATVSDNVGVAEVRLFYRTVGAGSYSQAVMEKDPNEPIYRGTIPAAAVTVAGVEYYLLASDSVPNTATAPDTAPATPYQVEVLALEADFSDDGYVDYVDLFLFALHWHLGPTSPNWNVIYDLSPGPDPSLGQPEQYIDFADLNLFTAAWHQGAPPSRGRVAVEKVGLTLALDLDPATPGIQNVLPCRGGDQVEVAVVAINATDLHGLNLDLAFDASAVQLVHVNNKPAQEGDLLGRNPAGEPTLFLATRSAAGLNLSTSILGRGAGVDGDGVLATLRLKIRKDTRGVHVLRLEQAQVTDHQGRLRVPARLHEAVLLLDGGLPTGGWAISLQALTAGGSDPANLLGVGAPWVVAEPPVPAGAVALALASESGQAPALRSVEVRAPSANEQGWPVVVTSPPGEPVTLAWSDLRQLPEHLTATLVDESSGQRVAMRTQRVYSFRAGDRETIRRLRVEVAPRGERLAVTGLSLQRGRGSPFTIGLILNRGARVSAELVTLSGRWLSALARDQSMGRGRGQLAWDGRDQQGRPLPPGIYLLRVSAEDEEGNRVSAVRAVTVR